MRPRGKTQRRYNEALQILSGKRNPKQKFSCNQNIIKPMAMKRRQGCPQTVLHLWDAIAYIRQQKQIPNFDRLAAYMKRVYNLNPTDLERQLKFAIQDGLIRVKKSVGCKGSKVGIEQDGYRLPEEIKEKDGHDWYCFECHRGGEVILCTTCHRVYHEVCLTDDINSGNFICPVCKNSEKFYLDLKRTELNILLGFTCIRLKEKTRELHRIPHPDDEKWRYNFVIYEPMDLVAMEDKMKANEYSSLGDFYTDAQQIVHNVIIYFGMHSRIAEMARQMLGDCEYDLQEIIQCRSCYKMSNMKHNPSWFCEPCDPPHELVYAKMKGFPYWPAKVIKKHENTYDVRFFGAFHQRALVNEEFVKPITTSFQKLNVKKTASFNRAYSELSHHQDLVAKFLKKHPSNAKLQTVKLNENSNNTESDSTQDSYSSSRSKTPTSRKRKSASVVVKPASAKKPASVPVKKNKKFYQESPTSSSPKNSSTQDIVIPEDHNLVSSSSQDTSVFHVSVAVQTTEELLVSDVERPQKSKEDSNDKMKKTCDCSRRYDKLLKDLRTQLDEEHKEDKAKALKEFSDKLRIEMENEKQKNLTAAVEKLQQDHKEALRKMEEQKKTAHQQEIRKLIEQHNLEISEIKKKQ
ncbi:Zinc finger MYND domain-containing protein 11, partial [Stegodyphus mimosarum]